MKQVSSFAEDHLIRLRKLGRADGKEERDEIRRLVRRLVGQLACHETDEQAPEHEESIILDLEVDGVRCTLVRRAPAARKDEAVALSPREREIARMVAKGYPNKVIARVLEISSWTVSTHLRRIFAKLGVSSRAAMVARLLEQRPPTAGS